MLLRILLWIFYFLGFFHFACFAWQTNHFRETLHDMTDVIGVDIVPRIVCIYFKLLSSIVDRSGPRVLKIVTS